MIVREEDNHLVLVRQADHALLSGWLAAAWGAPPWSPPEPSHSTVVSARLHDIGWTAFDEALPRGPEGRPYAFNEVSRLTSTRLHVCGINAVESIDAYAGLLASLHFSGFFTSHWGWSSVVGTVEPDEDERDAVERFVQHEIARQHRLRQRLGMKGTLDRQLMCHYVWLQLWDSISLDICRLGFAGWSEDYPATPVTTASEADVVRLHVELEPGGICRLDPYPLLPNPYRARIPAVRVPAAVASDAAALREAWQANGSGTIDVTFLPAG
jgi:hypothetical protein